jgi:predicted amidohydrolase
MQRRQFVQKSMAALGALTSSLDIAAISPAETKVAGSEKVGRPVRTVSVGFKHSIPLPSLAEMVDKEGAKGSDIIVLPETCRGQDGSEIESLDGPTISAMAQLAQKHHTYIVCPIDRKDGDRRYNSAVLLGRKGKVECVYDKLYPVWQVECNKQPPVTPGAGAVIYEADFGKIGFAICFDANWPSVWRHLGDQGVELVLFPSAYSAGRSLQAYAIQNNYYIMSATLKADCLLYDIDGELLAYEHNNMGDGTNITRRTIDLDRCIFHVDLNYPPLDKLMKDHSDSVLREKSLDLEAWFVLKAKRPGVSARVLARQYGLEELRHYVNRSQCEIDKCRGWQFS